MVSEATPLYGENQNNKKRLLGVAQWYWIYSGTREASYTYLIACQQTWKTALMLHTLILFVLKLFIVDENNLK